MVALLPMQSFEFRLEKGKTGTFAGENIDLTIERINKKEIFVCPDECQKICEFKKSIMNSPFPEGFACVTVLFRVRNFSSKPVFLKNSIKSITLSDYLNNNYSMQNPCEVWKTYVQDEYGTATSTGCLDVILGNIGESRFFLFFPKLSISAIEAGILTLNVRSYVLSHVLGEFIAADSFKIAMSENQENHSSIEIDKFQTLQLLSPPKSVSRQDWLSDGELSTLQTLSSPKLVPKQDPFSGEPMRFSKVEIDREVFGLCEDCENFTDVRYFNGLYMCSNCRDFFSGKN